jgi:hypothetical protein
MQVLDDAGQPATFVRFDRGFQVAIEYEIRETMPSASVLFSVLSDRGAHLWTSWDSDGAQEARSVREPGSYRSVCRVPGNLLRPGRYFLSVGCLRRGTGGIDGASRVLAFDVAAAGYPLNSGRQGLVTPVLDWRVEQVMASQMPAGDVS